MNKKNIIRDTKFEIRMSKEEKDLFFKYAENLGINPSRLARNLLMIEAEKNLISKGIEKAIIKAYIKYAEVTNNQEILERIKSEW